jgi:hypothetical protein
MRTVTFATESIAAAINGEFIPVWVNHSTQGIDPDFRDRYSTEEIQSARQGHGANRIFTLIVESDGSTLLRLPGFWKPEVFHRELRFWTTLTRNTALPSTQARAAEMTAASESEALLARFYKAAAAPASVFDVLQGLQFMGRGC